MVKKFFSITLFLLLPVLSSLEMSINATMPDDAPRAKQPRERRIQSAYEAMYQKFLKRIDDNKREYEQAREMCQQAGNCDDCPRFQKADAEKEDYEEKIKLIDEVNQLHAKLRENGLENGFDRQRTIRKIVNGW